MPAGGLDRPYSPAGEALRGLSLAYGPSGPCWRPADGLSRRRRGSCLSWRRPHGLERPS